MISLCKIFARLPGASGASSSLRWVYLQIPPCIFPCCFSCRQNLLVTAGKAMGTFSFDFCIFFVTLTRSAAARLSTQPDTMTHIPMLPRTFCSLSVLPTTRPLSLQRPLSEQGPLQQHMRAQPGHGPWRWSADA